MIVSLVAAMDRDYTIGRDGGLPWPRLPGELKLFQKTTLGKAVIVGRRTWESLPGRFLPGRHLLILTTHPAEVYAAYAGRVAQGGGLPGPGTTFGVCTDLDEARAGAEAVADAVMVIGGARVFDLTYSHADRFYLTIVEGQHRGDVKFPRDVFNDDSWDWDPMPVNGRGWTRHTLSRRRAVGPEGPSHG